MDSRSTLVKPCSRRERQRGYVVFTVAALGIVLIGFAGLVFDVGSAKYYKRKAQSAADAGALGAAEDIYLHGSASTNQLAAQSDITSNGFTNGVNGAQVTVNIPPNTGTHTGDSHYAEVYVTQPVTTSFMQLLGFNTINVTARAVGGPGRTSACVYVLNPTVSNALSISGSSTVNLTCGVVNNSSAGTAGSLSGSACFSAPSYASVGGYSVSSSCAPNVPIVRTGTGSFPDPLANLPAPTVGPCNFTNFSRPVSTTINPGVYCGGITLTGGTLTMNPGLYILEGGGLNIAAGTGLTGSNITIYNTGNASYPNKPIKINGNTTLNLVAPTSGTYEGILFFTDRSITNTTANTVLGNDTSTIQGSIYMPTVPLQFTGNSTLVAYTTIVANTLSITGHATLRNDYSSLQNGAPLKGGAAVVE